jgi:hypothetical protein
MTVGVSPYAVQNEYILAFLDYEFIMLITCQGRCVLKQFVLVTVTVLKPAVFYFI